VCQIVAPGWRRACTPCVHGLWRLNAQGLRKGARVMRVPREWVTLSLLPLEAENGGAGGEALEPWMVNTYDAVGSKNYGLGKGDMSEVEAGEGRDGPDGAEGRQRSAAARFFCGVGAETGVLCVPSRSQKGARAHALIVYG